MLIAASLLVSDPNIGGGVSGATLDVTLTRGERDIFSMIFICAKSFELSGECKFDGLADCLLFSFNISIFALWKFSAI